MVENGLGAMSYVALTHGLLPIDPSFQSLFSIEHVIQYSAGTLSIDLS